MTETSARGVARPTMRVDARLKVGRWVTRKWAVAGRRRGREDEDTGPRMDRRLVHNMADTCSVVQKKVTRRAHETKLI